MGSSYQRVLVQLDEPSEDITQYNPNGQLICIVNSTSSKALELVLVVNSLTAGPYQARSTT